jgi:pyruvate dehydrogenase E2 component (dihydrolipoamide acetyltransferase)
VHSTRAGVARAGIAQNAGIGSAVGAARSMSSYPEHLVVGMPSLSPTMETGVIVGWNKKEGERFEAGESICEVETDKATVAFEATDAGYLAKILVQSGEVSVGHPIMVTVEEEDQVAAFADFKAPSSGSAPAPAAAAPAAAAPAAAPAAAAPTAPAAPAPAAPAPAESTGRVVASPYARRLATEGGLSINAVGEGSGPGGRVIAEDVKAALSRPKAAAAAPVAAAAAPAPAAAPAAGQLQAGTDFSISPIALALGNLFSVSKKTVPHYHLSVELNLTKV